ncbi:transporter substrate-binding domain-containing protein [Thermoactinomyces sp. AMNI-1]|uniref:Transporter substrate-binding domain-containing protein n=1 Tax=Thermoactinomyces mirandus TaxID=2756294 RepID=A0A7W1XQK0_9BACL|nr:ABC transporter substrate-binding protein [Thermoactinomyces mirandus]MBA4601443.1 transporter substrate-binding domain-containing protein [Thermoactinomyces mirandus]
MKKEVFAIRLARITFVCILVLSFLALTACSPVKPEGQLTLQRGTFTFAMSGLYKPFNYHETEKGSRLTGFDVDIGKALAKEMGLRPNPVAVPWETIIAGLQMRKYDAIIGSMGITNKRKKAVNFTDPYYRSGAQIFVAKENLSIRSADDLKGKTIGVVKATTFKDVALEYSSDIVEYTSDITALQDLPTGRVDAVITDRAVGLYAMSKMNFLIKDIDTPLTEDEMGIAIHKGDRELRQKLNQALEQIIKDGTYEKISYRYFNRNILRTTTDENNKE